MVDELLAAEQQPALRNHARASPRWTDLTRPSSSSPTCRANAIISSRSVGRTSGAKNWSENPAIGSGPSGIQTSSDMFVRPGSMLIVQFGQTKWYWDS